MLIWTTFSAIIVFDHNLADTSRLPGQTSRENTIDVLNKQTNKRVIFPYCVISRVDARCLLRWWNRTRHVHRSDAVRINSSSLNPPSMVAAAGRGWVPSCPTTAVWRLSWMYEMRVAAKQLSSGGPGVWFPTRDFPLGCAASKLAPIQSVLEVTSPGLTPPGLA